MSPLLLIALAAGPAGSDIAFAIRVQGAMDQVRRLGHPAYRTREAAGRELVRLGEAALGPLRTAERDADPERGARCRTVRVQVEERLFETKLNRLVSRPALPPPDGLPVVGRFLEAAGDSPESRALYVGAFRRCRPVLEALPTGSAGSTEQIREYMTRLNERLRQPRPTTADEEALRLRADELAAVTFLVGQTPAAGMAAEVHDAVNRVWYEKDAADLLVAAAPNGPQRRLFLAALRRHGDVALARPMLWLVARSKMTDAVPVLIELLGDSRLNEMARGEVLVCLGAVGTREAADRVRRMTALFESTTEVNSVQFPRDWGLPVMSTQLRDVAVGVCAQLEDRSLDELGFHPKPLKYYSGYPSTARYALPDDGCRAEVHRRWREPADQPKK